MKESKPKQILNSGVRKVIRIAQWPLEAALTALIYFGDKRRLFPEGFKKALVYILLPIVGGVVSWLGIHSSYAPAWWPAWSFLPTFAAVVAFFVSMATGFTAFIIVRGILPLLFFVPHAVTLRNMGLLEARNHKQGMPGMLRKYLDFHDEDQPVKVICISGRSLFSNVEAIGKAPLWDQAVSGKLEVLMPRSCPNNPTVAGRYGTYNNDFKKANYPVDQDLVREIEISKELLKSNGGNKVFVHDELCMWRVVILSEHCLVQNYFPNHSGCQSDASPVFVFEKEENFSHSYYETFLQMFLLLAKEKI